MEDKSAENKEILERFGVFGGTKDPAMEEAFKKVSGLYLRQNVKWESTSFFEFPMQAQMNQQQWKIRINDFPDEPMYTLLVNGTAIITFDEWPKNWERPVA